MSAPPEPNPGLWGSAKRLLDTLLAVAQNRMELFAVELQEEKCRLVEAMLWAAAVAAFGIMTLTVVTFAIVVRFWDSGRLTALVTLGILYLLGTAFAWRSLQKRLTSRPPFNDTIAELKKDRSCLDREK